MKTYQSPKCQTICVPDSDILTVSGIKAESAGVGDFLDAGSLTFH